MTSVAFHRRLTVTPRAGECLQCRSQTTTPTATFRTRGRGPTETVVTSTRTAWTTATLAVPALSRHLVSTAVTSLSITLPDLEHRCLDFHRLSNVIATVMSEVLDLFMPGAHIIMYRLISSFSLVRLHDSKSILQIMCITILKI